MTKKYNYKAKPGKPTSYDPKFIDKLISCAKEGKSVIQTACEIGVHKDTLYTWAKKHAEFADAMLLGKQFAEAYWENFSQTHSKTGAAAQHLKYYMGVRFGWRDVQVVDQNLDVTSKGEAIVPLVIAPVSYNPNQGEEV